MCPKSTLSSSLHKQWKLVSSTVCTEYKLLRERERERERRGGGGGEEVRGVERLQTDDCLSTSLNQVLGLTISQVVGTSIAGLSL